MKDILNQIRQLLSDFSKRKGSACVRIFRKINSKRAYSSILTQSRDAFIIHWAILNEFNRLSTIIFNKKLFMSNEEVLIPISLRKEIFRVVNYLALYGNFQQNLAGLLLKKTGLLTFIIFFIFPCTALYLISWKNSSTVENVSSRNNSIKSTPISVKNESPPFF